MTVKYVLNDTQEHGIMYLRVATDSSNHQSTKLFLLWFNISIGNMGAFSQSCLKSKVLQTKHL